MAISVYSIFEHTPEIERWKNDFEEYNAIYPDQCDTSINVLKRFEKTAQDLVDALNRQDVEEDFMNDWYEFLGYESKVEKLSKKALEIRRLLHKFRTYCPENGTKHAKEYESIYRWFKALWDDLRQLQTKLPTKAAPSAEAIKPNPLQTPSYSMRTSTSTL